MRRAASIFLCFSLMVSLVCTNAFAAQQGTSSERAALESVLRVVKNKVTIPAEFVNFSYDVENIQGVRHWNLTWSSDDDSYNGINITADDKGIIYSYSKDNYDYYYNMVTPKITKAEAKEKAKAYIKKIAPELTGHLSKDAESVDGYGNEYRFAYTRVENGVSCVGHTAVIGVAVDTGEFSRYNLNWDFNTKYVAPKNPISEEKARSIWKNALDLELVYLTDYSNAKEEDKETHAILAYVSKTEQKPINAESGEIIEKNFDWEQYDLAEGIGGAGAGGDGDYSNYSGYGNSDLTENEIKKLAELGGLLTAAQADKIIRSMPNISLDKSYKLANSYLNKRNSYNKNETNGKYVWNIVYTSPVIEGDYEPNSIEVQVEAKTGELLSYYDYWYSGDEPGKAVIDQATANSRAETLVKKASPDKFKETKLFTEEDAQEETKDKDAEPEVYNTTLVRQHNNIAFYDNSIYINIRAATGKITSYYVSWDDNVNFESPDKIIDKTQAANLYLAAGNANYGYNIITTYLYDKKPVDGEKVFGENPEYDSDLVERKYSSVLAYNFDIESPLISATSGNLIDYWGEEISKDSDEEFKGYTDLEGCPEARDITILCDAGILPPSSQFKPNDGIMQKDFIRFMLSAMGCWVSPDDTEENLNSLYEDAANYGILKQSDRDPGRVLNRYEAMAMMVHALGYGKISEESSMFKANFNDAPEIPKTYIGTAALAKYFKLTDGRKSSFNGAEKVTRAEAAQLILRFLNALGTEEISNPYSY